MKKRNGRGYLVLAGISGLPAKLAGIELEHANEILDDLLELVIDQVSPALMLATLERDALFAFAPEKSLRCGETLLEVLESTYFHFKDYQAAVARANSCACQACRHLPDLDLKFIVHFGKYQITRIADILEIGGPEVELLRTRQVQYSGKTLPGWRGVALLTRACLEQMGGGLEGTRTFSASNPKRGEGLAAHVDLGKRYQTMIASRLTAEG